MCIRNFVFEDDILESAITKQNIEGEDDYTCHHLMASFINRWHTMTISRDLNIKYVSMLMRLSENAPIDIGMITLLRGVLIDSRRVIRLPPEGSAEIADCELILRQIVRRTEEPILVTQNPALSQRLQATDQNLIVYTPAQAIELAISD